jgi:hypothetical protein
MIHQCDRDMSCHGNLLPHHHQPATQWTLGSKHVQAPIWPLNLACTGPGAASLLSCCGCLAIAAAAAAASR